MNEDIETNETQAGAEKARVKHASAVGTRRFLNTLRAEEERRPVGAELAGLYQEDSIVNTVTGAGTSLDQSVQARPAIGEYTQRLLPHEMDYLYAHTDLARIGCDSVVTDAWQSGYVALNAETNEELADPYKVADHMQEACYSARRTGVGAVLLVTKRASTEWDQELKDDEEFVRFMPLEREEFPNKGDVQRDWTDKWFGRPEWYGVAPIIDDEVLDEVEVHPSRLFFVRGEKLPKTLATLNDGWDDSILQQVWPPISRFLQTEMGITSIVVRFELATMLIDGLAEVLSTVDGPAILHDRLQMVQKTRSLYNAVIVDGEAGEDYVRKFASLQGLDTAWDRMAHSVAKAFRMSMTRLFGMSPSGLATDDQSGRANWRVEIQSYRSSKVEPALRAYYKWLYPGVEVEIKWNKLEELTHMEEASLMEKKAKARELYVRAGIALPEELKEILIEERVITGSLTPETPEDDPGSDPAVQAALASLTSGGEGEPGGGEELSPEAAAAVEALRTAAEPQTPVA